MTRVPSKKGEAINIQGSANSELRHIALEAKFNTEGCTVRKVEKSWLAGAVMKVSGGRAEAVSQEDCAFLKMRVERRNDLRAKT